MVPVTALLLVLAASLAQAAEQPDSNRVPKYKPAGCPSPLGYYGTSCNRLCQKCPGDLCGQYYGDCVYEKCHTDNKKTKIAGCDCTYHGAYTGYTCNFKHTPIQNLHLQQTEARVYTTYDAPSGTSGGGTLQVHTDWWIYDGTWSPLSPDAPGGQVPLRHGYIYLACVMVIAPLAAQEQYLANPACATLDTSGGCAGVAKNINKSRASSSDVRWVYIDGGGELHHYKVTMNPKDARCNRERPISLRTASTETKITLNETLKGQWNVCILGVKEPVDPDCHKHSKCKELSFGPFPNEIEKLSVTPWVQSVGVAWTISDFWWSRCNLNQVSVASRKNRGSGRGDALNITCDARDCSVNIPNLEGSVPYTIEVRGIQNNGAFGQRKTKEATPLSEPPLPVPTASSGVFNVSEQNETELARYSIPLDGGEMSCEISAKDVETSNLSLNISCLANPEGVIKSSRLLPGREYALSYAVCNSRACSAPFAPLLIWTPPSAPVVAANVSLIATGPHFIRLLIPDFGRSSYGSIYILTINASGRAAPDWGPPDAEAFVRGQLEDPTRKRDLQGGRRPVAGDIALAANLSLSAREYLLSISSALAGDLRGRARLESVFVSSVAVFQAGEYRKMGATSFAGPFEFSAAKTASFPLLPVAIALGVALVLVVVVGTSAALFWKRRQIKRNANMIGYAADKGFELQQPTPPPMKYTAVQSPDMSDEDYYESYVPCNPKEAKVKNCVNKAPLWRRSPEEHVYH